LAISRPSTACDNYLKGPAGDRINAVLAAAGYNFGLLLRWPAAHLRALIMALASFIPLLPQC
jgi:IS5 family transposase